MNIRGDQMKGFNDLEGNKYPMVPINEAVIDQTNYRFWSGFFDLVDIESWILGNIFRNDEALYVNS